MFFMRIFVVVFFPTISKFGVFGGVFIIIFYLFSLFFFLGEFFCVFSCFFQKDKSNTSLTYIVLNSRKKSSSKIISGGYVLNSII